jgi:hypothetical protein
MEKYVHQLHNKGRKGRNSVVVEKIGKEINNIKEVIRFQKYGILGGGVKLCPHVTSVTIWPIVPAPDDE